KTFTPAEKKAAKEAVMSRKVQNNQRVSSALLEVWKLAEGLHRDIGTNTAQYWYEYLLQRAGKKKTTRRPSTWNAFVSLKVKAHNDALPDGTPRVKAPAIMTELRNKWKLLSSVEKIETTQETVTKLGEIREMRNYATHNVSLNAFHDARATLKSVQTQLENLFNRTGVEFLLFASRSDSSAFMHPMSWSTGDHIDEYFQMTFKKSTGQFAGMLECFLLSGLEGTVKTYQNELMELKQKTAKLIFEKLETAAHPHKVSRMFYSDFHHHITEKYGIIIENWPLSVFTSPGNIGSRIELNTLFNAWESGATRFRRLTPAELIEWERQQSQAHLQQTTPASQALGNSDASSNAPVAGGPIANPDAQPTPSTSTA
ncbi:hypothetical protein BC835DRAFT_1247004, partial [Cytidiella melzeri]